METALGACVGAGDNKGNLCTFNFVVNLRELFKKMSLKKHSWSLSILFSVIITQKLIDNISNISPSE